MSPDGTPESESYDRPVAYDADGRPLYAHPVDTEVVSEPIRTAQPQQSVVHVTRSLEPVAVEISPELQDKHDRSVKKYPQLDLSPHEYVLLSVRRHLIGLAMPFAVTFILVCIILAALILLPDLLRSTGWQVDNLGMVYLIGCAATVLVVTGMYVLYWVYVSNKFFLTNESIIERTQLSLFSSNVKSVGLGDVVDVSYHQTGLVEQIFDVGMVKVGTKDDEVPYVFHTVRDPKKQASILKDAVECFKNGRPVGQALEDTLR